MRMAKGTRRLQFNFMRKMKEDPAMRARFEAGYEEAKSGTGKRYTLEEVVRLAQKGGGEHGGK